uniref:uncharacterized protein LOC101374633 n=1 Tax=Odobenus rosmarus divergens TaxID=9708 RepID=UPI00063CB64C|nr:PREDICTED: uncharacterized protein LOC101374633 [Odobenus rosmarus divergens]
MIITTPVTITASTTTTTTTTTTPHHLYLQHHNHLHTTITTTTITVFNTITTDNIETVFCSTWEGKHIENTERQTASLALGSLLTRTLILKDQNPTLTASFVLNHVLRGPTFKYSHTGGWDCDVLLAGIIERNFPRHGTSKFMFENPWFRFLFFAPHEDVACVEVGVSEKVLAFRIVQRLTYRCRLSYNTISNKTRLSRTPGNRIIYLYTKKVGKAPKSACGVCSGQLQGVRAVRPKVLMRLSKTRKHVSRAYGGSMCAKCVRDMIKRAFFIEEQKIVVKVLKTQAQSQKAK